MPSRPPRANRTLLLLLVISGLLRAGVLVAGATNLDRDPDSYARLARVWHDTGTYGVSAQRPTAFRPPLYPALLMPLAGNGLSRLEIAALHLVIGLATIALTWQLARLWNLERIAWVAAALVALDPILLNQSTVVMTESLATLLAVLALCALTIYFQRESATFATLTGGALGLAVLCRPTFLPWTLLIAVLVGLSSDRGRGKVAHALLLFLATGVVLLPWALRNARQLGTPIVTTTHGGYTLWLAHNDWLYDYLLERDRAEPGVWTAEPLAARQQQIMRDAGGDERLADRRMYDEAWGTIIRRPAAALLSCCWRLASFWSPLPKQLDGNEPLYYRLARYAVGVWYVALYVTALVGLLQLRRSLPTAALLGALALCLTLSAIHTVYWSDMRMRAPLMPVTALLGATGFATLVGRSAWTEPASNASQTG